MTVLSLPVFLVSAVLSPPHHDAGFTLVSFLAGIVVLLFVNTLPEPLSFGGGALCLLSHGVSASAVLDNAFCVPLVMLCHVLR